MKILILSLLLLPLAGSAFAMRGPLSPTDKISKPFYPEAEVKECQGYAVRTALAIRFDDSYDYNSGDPLKSRPEPGNWPGAYDLPLSLGSYDLGARDGKSVTAYLYHVKEDPTRPDESGGLPWDYGYILVQKTGTKCSLVSYYDTDLDWRLNRTAFDQDALVKDLAEKLLAR